LGILETRDIRGTKSIRDISFVRIIGGSSGTRDSQTIKLSESDLFFSITARLSESDARHYVRVTHFQSIRL
jgi:hypothetical protein